MNGIEARVRAILAELEEGNGYGEPVTLVAATKTRTAEEILLAVRAGVRDVGENRVQEFIAKYDAVTGARRHFIGRLQTNKVKYLVGKCDLIHSVDRDALMDAIDARAKALGVVQPVLVEVNAGREPTKGGYPPEEAEAALLRAAEKEGLAPLGYMAMLPATEDLSLLAGLADAMRALFEHGKTLLPIRYLSMGMSGDYKLCLGHGANMIRLGTSIFGERN